MATSSVVPAPDLLKATVRQPLLDVAPANHCYISFRAGILERNEGKLCSDKRKGQVAIVKNDAGANAIQWYERIFQEGGTQAFKLADEPDIDQMVFEFECEFTWVRKEARILKLAFKEESFRDLFFWLQEPDASFDDAIVERCNKAIVGNHWKQGNQQAGEETAAIKDTEAAREAMGAARCGSVQPHIQADALRQMLAHMASVQADIRLEQVLTPAALRSLVQDSAVRMRLLEFLPDGQQTDAELLDLGSCTQFWQQMRAFSHGIQSGRVNTDQFGVSQDAPGTAAFLKALQDVVNSASDDAEEARRKESRRAGGPSDRSGGPDGGPGPAPMDEG